MRIVSIVICIALWGLSTAGTRAQDPHTVVDAGSFFRTSDQCIACHSNLRSAGGEDVSIGYSWRASMMANSARDPYWHAAVRREVTDHPIAQAAIEDKCSTCHMPMARFTAAQVGGHGEVLSNIFRATGPVDDWALDGVSCTVCHQIRDDNFGDDTSYTGGFSIDTSTPPEEREIYGPHAVDAGRRRLMQSATGFLPGESTHLQRSEMCATCHTLYTHALNAAGEEIGELAEQVPYLEWFHSDYRTTQSCQDCHMPELAQDAPISSVLGERRPDFSQHVFRGGNAFMLGILNTYRGELGVKALPQEFDAAIRRTQVYLGTQTARLTIGNVSRAGSELRFDVVVGSLAGHKLPTAYPSRRAWLHIVVSDDRGRVLFESGAVSDNGSIAGNENDLDGSRYEPHYDLIEKADQVQIYEPIMVDINGEVTTGLLSGVRYVKDNRILPLGFDKTAADHDVAIFGAAMDDDDFVGGSDRITYTVTGAGNGTLTLEAELLYQTIGYRWAENLRSYRSEETDRFVRYYEQNAADAAIRLAVASVETN